MVAGPSSVCGQGGAGPVSRRVGDIVPRNSAGELRGGSPSRSRGAVWSVPAQRRVPVPPRQHLPRSQNPSPPSLSRKPRPQRPLRQRLQTLRRQRSRLPLRPLVKRHTTSKSSSERGTTLESETSSRTRVTHYPVLSVLFHTCVISNGTRRSDTTLPTAGGCYGKRIHIRASNQTRESPALHDVLV